MSPGAEPNLARGFTPWQGSAAQAQLWGCLHNVFQSHSCILWLQYGLVWDSLFQNVDLNTNEPEHKPTEEPLSVSNY